MSLLSERHGCSQSLRTDVGPDTRDAAMSGVRAGHARSGTITGYLLLTFMPAFLVKSAGLSQTQSVVSVVIAQTALIISLPVGGYLSDRLGRRPMLFIVSLSQFVIALPSFALLQLGGIVWPRFW
jgi:MFS family permease